MASRIDIGAKDGLISSRAFAPTVVATPAASSTPPASSERLASLAAQLPKVERDTYVVSNEVAKGGIGRVVRARDQRLDRPVAIKELLARNEAQEQRFMREALLTARLQHPAIVPIYEAGRWPDGEPFYAMRLVSGRTLSELIGARRTLAERLALLPHVLAVAQAIAYAHSQRIIHRDLKPANVLVGEFGETMVIDWGLAKGLSEDDPTSGDAPVISGEGLTVDGAIVGTPAYMPPEQAAGEAVDERADVYAIGAMLYHLLARVPPYSDVPWEKLLATISSRPPRAIERLVPDLPDELRAIVQLAMAREPNARYRTAKELADDLHRFQTGQIVGAHTYSSAQLLRRFWRRKRTELSIAAGAALLVTLVVIGAFVQTDAERRFALVKQGEAQDARAAAEQAQGAAEAAGRDAVSRADELTLLQAQGALARDPNEALAWLKTLSPGFSDASEMRRIAADANARGISRAFRGHTAHINDLLILDEGKRFVTASDDKTLRVWDTATATSRVLVGHADEAWCLVALPGGDRIASGSKDRTVRIWDLGTGETIAHVRAPSQPRQMGVRPDGTIVGTPLLAGAPWSWAPGAAEARALSEPSEEIEYSSITKDGKWLVAQRKDDAAWVMEIETGKRRAIGSGALLSGEWVLSHDGRLAAHIGKKVRELWDLGTMTSKPIDVTGPLRHAEITRAGDRIAFGTDEGIALFDTKTGHLLRRFPESGASTRWIGFSDDGETLATGGFDRLVRTWSLTKTDEARTHAGLQGAMSAVRFIPGTHTIFAASSAGDARLFEPVGAGTVLTDHHANATGLALSKDGRAASVDEQGKLRITDLSGRQIVEHSLPPATNVHLRASPDKTRFVGAPILWLETETGRAVATTHDPQTLLLGTFDETKPAQVTLPAAVHYLTWRRDGKAVFVALADGTVRQVDLAGTIIEVDRVATPVVSLAVSEDGERLACGTEDGAVRLTSLLDDSHVELGRHKARVLSLAFSRDGASLASGSIDHTARLWNLGEGSFRSFDAGGGGVLQLKFSADAATLFLLNLSESILRRWDVKTGEELAPFTGHENFVGGFSISDDGRTILTFSGDRTARVIDAQSGKGRSLSGHSARLRAAQFAAGGKLVVTLGYEGTVRAWPDDLPTTIPELRAWIDGATPDRIQNR